VFHWSCSRFSAHDLHAIDDLGTDWSRKHLSCRVEEAVYAIWPLLFRRLRVAAQFARGVFGVMSWRDGSRGLRIHWAPVGKPDAVRAYIAVGCQGAAEAMASAASSGAGSSRPIGDSFVRPWSSLHARAWHAIRHRELVVGFEMDASADDAGNPPSACLAKPCCMRAGCEAAVAWSPLAHSTNGLQISVEAVGLGPDGRSITALGVEHMAVQRSRGAACGHSLLVIEPTAARLK